MARSGDDVLAQLVARIREAIEVQARSLRWKLPLPPGFADDAARNAAAGMIDLVDPEFVGDDDSSPVLTGRKDTDR